MTEQAIVTWARQLVERKAFILHRGLGVVGRAAQVWPAGEYLDENARRVSTPVLGLEDGNAFVLRADETDQIVELTPAEVDVYDSLLVDLRMVLTGGIIAMSQRVKDPARLPTALAVLQAALSSQLRALRSGGA